MESLQEAPSNQQQQVNEETASEASEIISEAENEEPLDEKETSERLQQTGIPGCPFLLFAFIVYHILSFFGRRQCLTES